MEKPKRLGLHLAIQSWKKTLRNKDEFREFLKEKGYDFNHQNTEQDQISHDNAKEIMKESLKNIPEERRPLFWSDFYSLAFDYFDMDQKQKLLDLIKAKFYKENPVDPKRAKKRMQVKISRKEIDMNYVRNLILENNFVDEIIKEMDVYLHNNFRSFIWWEN